LYFIREEKICPQNVGAHSGKCNKMLKPAKTLKKYSEKAKKLSKFFQKNA